MAAVATLYGTIRAITGPPDLERLQLNAIIAWLLEQKRWLDSAPLLADMIDRFPEHAAPARIKLAHLCVIEFERPRKATELLSCINPRALPDESARLIKTINARAQQMLAGGSFEVDSNDW